MGQDYTMAFPYRDTPPIHHKKHNYQFAKKLGCCWQFKLFGNTFVYLPCHHECKFEYNKTKTKTLNDVELFTYSCGEYKSKDKISNIIKESLKNTNFDNQITANSLSVPLKEAREKFEKEYLTIQLKKFNGNISKTANFVGMDRTALHRKLKMLGVKDIN